MTSESLEQRAREAVSSIFTDLEDRCELKWYFQRSGCGRSLDDETLDEIRGVWGKILAAFAREECGRTEAVVQRGLDALCEAVDAFSVLQDEPQGRRAIKAMDELCNARDALRSLASGPPTDNPTEERDR